MTPLPVPIHRRLQDTMRAVILTKEKPSLPVPAHRSDVIKSFYCEIKTLHTRRYGIGEPTEHLADVGLDVDVLEVLVGASVEQPEGGVQFNRHPDAIAVPGQLTNLTVLTGVGIKWFLRGAETCNANVDDAACLNTQTHLYLDLHGSGMHHIDLVPVATPHPVVHDRHAADGVMLLPQVQQVVVGQVPLSIWQQKVEMMNPTPVWWCADIYLWV